jgi:hypothetical protein
LNEYGFNECRQTEIQTAEPLVHEHSASELYIAIEKLKRHKSPNADRIPAEMIKAGGRTIRFEVHNLIHSMLYVFFWVIPRRLIFICRRFGTLSLFHLHRQVGVKNEIKNYSFYLERGGIV